MTSTPISHIVAPPPVETPNGVFWNFRVQAVKRSDGKFHVRIVGNITGEVRERVGYHPLWELIRLIGDRQAAREFVERGGK